MPTARVWRVSDPSRTSKIEEVMDDIRFSTLDEISSRLPNGIYSTFRTFDHNQTLRLESHFYRLIESANLIIKPIILNFQFIRESIREVVRLSTEQELRIRLTINPDIFPAEIFISVEPLNTPTSEDYDMGVFTVLQKKIRDNPKAKITSFLKNAELIRRSVAGKINEVLLVNNDEQILEGLSSNFFAVINGEIWTEGEQVLSGFVRSAILELADENGIHVHLSAIHISDIDHLEEAFLTSTSRSVLPIQRMNTTTIKNGKPGNITKKLTGLYQQFVQRSLEEI
jgi:branched-chain amino acid aminotransferase